MCALVLPGSPPHLQARSVFKRRMEAAAREVVDLAQRVAVASGCAVKGPPRFGAVVHASDQAMSMCCHARTIMHSRIRNPRGSAQAWPDNLTFHPPVLLNCCCQGARACAGSGA